MLMHNIAGMKRTSGGRKDIPTPEEEAEGGLYWLDDEKTSLAVPSIAIHGCFLKQAPQYKLPQRKSLQRLITSALHVSPEMITLNKKWYDKIDERSAVVQKNRIFRCRARISLPWTLNFSLFFDPTYLPLNLMRGTMPNLITEAGQLIGLLDYRVEKKGPFGKFRLERYELLPQQYEEPLPDPLILGFDKEDANGSAPKKLKASTKRKKSA